MRERGGFALCPVCFWEDDGQDDSDADFVKGGRNGRLSLAAGRLNYQKCGACDPKFVSHVRRPTVAEAAAD